MKTYENYVKVVEITHDNFVRVLLLDENDMPLPHGDLYYEIIKQNVPLELRAIGSKFLLRRSVVDPKMSDNPIKLREAINASGEVIKINGI